MGFDVEFPALRSAVERLKTGDNRTRRFGTEMSTSLRNASGAAGNGPLSDTLDDLADSMQRQADKTANVVEEIWQAVDKAEARYDADDQHAAGDIRAVQFGGHDGIR